MPPLGQRRQPSATGRGTTLLPDWSPSSPDLYGCPGSRETPARPALSREMRGPMPLGVSDALASATCVSPLRVTDAGRQRRDGGQASYSSFQPCYRNSFGQHGQGSAAVAKCHPWFLILARLPGQRRGEPRALLTYQVARSRPA